MGLVLLAATTLLFALGTNAWILLIARVLQGLSSSVVYTLGSALVLDTVGQDSIGRALGYTGMGLTMGLLVGPVLGGVLYEYGGYFHVFIPAFGLIGLELILRMLVIEQEHVPKIESTAEVDDASKPNHTFTKHGYGTVDSFTLDHSGEFLAEGRHDADANDTDYWTEHEHAAMKLESASPVLVTLLSSPRLSTAISVLFILNSIGTGFDGVMPAYIHDTFQLNAIHAACFFSIIGLPMLLAPVSGALSDRIGSKWPAACGIGIAAPSLFLLRTIVPGVAHPEIKLGILLCLWGLGCAFAMTPLMTEVTSVVEEMELARPNIFGPNGASSQAYGLTGTAFAAGSLVGPLYAGFVRERLGWPAMSTLLGALAVFALIAVMLVTGTNAVLEDHIEDEQCEEHLESISGTESS